MKRALIVPAVAASVLWAGGWARAQAPAPELDPCADEIGFTAVNACWARAVERADEEMDSVYRTLLEKLPSRAASNLEKAQKLWREFRDAHVSTLYGVENPFTVWGREYPICVSISRYVMAQARTEQLRRLLEPVADTACPL